MLKACRHSVPVHCMSDVFLISRLKKAMTQYFWVWFLKLKQLDTRVNYNKATSKTCTQTLDPDPEKPSEAKKIRRPHGTIH